MIPEFHYNTEPVVEDLVLLFSQLKVGQEFYFTDDPHSNMHWKRSYSHAITIQITPGKSATLLPSRGDDRIVPHDARVTPAVWDDPDTRWWTRAQHTHHAKPDGMSVVDLRPGEFFVRNAILSAPITQPWVIQLIGLKFFAVSLGNYSIVSLVDGRFSDNVYRVFPIDL